MIRYFFRPLWESLKNLKRNFWMTFASVTSMVITLTLVAVVGSVLMNVDRAASSVEDKVQVSVYMDLGTADDSKQITNSDGKQVDNPDYHKVYDKIKALTGVKDVTFSSKDEELKKLQETSPDTFKTLEGDANPLQDVYYVKVTKGTSVKSISQAIKGIAGVESVKYGGDDMDTMLKFAKGVRLWGSVGVVVFIIIAMLLISNTIRLTIRARKNDIEIMRLVGATNAYISGPFFFEGAWVGLLGSILPAAILYYGYHFLYRDFTTNYKGLSLYTPNEFLPYAIGGLFAFGIILGAFTSIISMRRYLRA